MQGDAEGVSRAYGLEDGGALVQELGCCSTPARRALAWPNSLQHRVGPFELIDRGRAGRREILVFFLVDPGVRVLSTRDVPPQQLDWMRMELRMMPAFRRLPSVLLEKVVEALGAPLTVLWEWHDDDDGLAGGVGSWKPFNDADAAMLEAAYKEHGPHGKLTTTRLSFNARHLTPYELDFGRMTQTNTRSKRSRAVRRDPHGGKEETHLLGFAAAAKRREALMEERKFFVDESSKEIFEREFSLCEH